MSYDASIEQQILSLSKIFPDIDVGVIRLALEASGFHPERASIMLIDMNATTSAPSPPPPPPANSTANFISTPQTPSVLPPNFLLLPGMLGYVSQLLKALPQAPPRTTQGPSSGGTVVVGDTVASDATTIMAETLAKEDVSVVGAGVAAASTAVNASVAVVEVEGGDVNSRHDYSDDDDDGDDDDDDGGGLLFRP